MKRTYLMIILCVVFHCANAQVKNALNAPRGWQHLDLEKDSVWGSSINRAHEFLKQFTPKQKVLVTVLDAGGDVSHEDLKNKLWVNPKEVAGDKKDNDGNGYIDDINGWNFIGYSDGRQQQRGILEANREFLRLRGKYDTYDTLKFSKKELQEYRYFRNEVLKRPGLPSLYAKLDESKAYLKYLPEYGKQIKEKVPNPETKFSYNFSHKISPADKDDKIAAAAFRFFGDRLRGLPVSKWDSVANAKDNWAKEAKEEFEKACSNNQKYVDSLAIIDPNQNDINKRFYGNNVLIARGSDHGTHVGGIIGAERNNGLGMNGVSDAELMFVRVIAFAEDETDKNVASGIRYAVDNGAKLINMSFGKYLSPNRAMVYEAMRYAEKKGVLLVHAAGNDSKNIDQGIHYPVREQPNKPTLKNMIEVGSSTWKGEPSLFSNYGKKTVDVFAPGSEIYSTVPGNKYLSESGTSMATPVVSGIAALLWTYFPDLTAVQMIDILKKSVTPKKGILVVLPSRGANIETKVDFAELCSSGGIVNAYQAAQLAAKMSKSH